MYKVFIQDRPIFFITTEEISNYLGFYISQALAESHANYLINLVSGLPEDISIYIVCDDPEAAIPKFFNNHEIIEAAGGIVRRKDEFLFIKRNGIWDLPKGKMDDGETPEFTAQREIEEECGIKFPVVQDLILITYHTYSFYGVPTIKKTYWYELLYHGSKDVVPQEEEGITEVVWKKQDKLGKILKNTYNSIREVITTYFESSK